MKVKAGSEASKTALELAESSEWAALDRLISAHAERAEEMDDFGMMPLHWACTDTHVPLRVVKKLVEVAPSALAHKNKGGLIPLHIAVKAKTKLEVITALVTGAADDGDCVFEETPTGETAAELAQAYHLSADKVAYLTNTEEALRAAGKGPARPSARFQNFLQQPGGFPLDDGSLTTSCNSFRSLPPALSSNRGGDAGRASRNQSLSGLRAMDHTWATTSASASMNPVNGALRFQNGLAPPSDSGSTVPLPPRWRLDKRCNICQLKFNYFKTRHHCRSCGESVCSTHSNRRLPLHHLGLKTPQRVCILCYDDLRENGAPSAVVNMYGHGRASGLPESDGLARQESMPVMPKHRSSVSKLKHGSLSVKARPPLRSANSNVSLTATSTSSRSPSEASDRYFHTAHNPSRRFISGSGDSSEQSAQGTDAYSPASELPFDEELLGRPRAWTDLDSTEKYLEMQDQVRELEAHSQELENAKSRLEGEMQRKNDGIAADERGRLAADRAVAELRNNRIIDINRIMLDDDEEEDHENRNNANIDAAQENEDKHKINEKYEDEEVPVEEQEVNVAMTCNYLGQVFLDRGEFTTAAVEFRKSVEANRKDPEVWINLARALHGAGEFYDAEIAIRRSLALSAKSYASLTMLGKILHAKGEHDKAVEIFREALSIMTQDDDSDDDVGSMTVGW